MSEIRLDPKAVETAEVAYRERLATQTSGEKRVAMPAAPSVGEKPDDRMTGSNCHAVAESAVPAREALAVLLEWAEHDEGEAPSGIRYIEAIAQARKALSAAREARGA